MEVSDVPPALQERLGREATAGLLELFETARQEWVPDVTTAAVERFDRRFGEQTGLLRAEIAALRLEMHDGIAALRQDMSVGFASVRQHMAAGLASVRQDMATGLTSVRQENADARFELLKWCFVFWIGQVFAVAGVFALVLRLMQT